MEEEKRAEETPLQENIAATEENTASETVNIEEELKKQVEEQKDKYLRLFAEFDNYKKRMAKERLELFATAGKDIVLEVIPTIDDLERALKSSESATDIASVREGFVLVVDKFKKALEKKGVKPIDAIQQDFDPEKHEAITEIPAPTEELKGKVLDEIEKGYTMHDKMIRFSKVVVGK